MKTLHKHLIAKTQPSADKENIVLWKDYRITVLQNRLFRVEKGCDTFCDEATLSIWYRNMPKQNFEAHSTEDKLIIKTKACQLLVKDNYDDCRIVLNGQELPLCNVDNLKGTYRTLDNYDGDVHVYEWEGPIAIPYGEKITLEDGVCSKSGIAVICDDNNLLLDDSGMPKNRATLGIDRYVFAYGDDYLAAVKALYMITGATPMIPRFALGNWWSRYHAYDEREYLALMNKFEDRNVPITVSVIDMDWHYSWNMDEIFHVTEQGLNRPEFGWVEGENKGWTGYTWNEKLFPDYKRFLKELQNRGLRVSLNLHPAQGVRWWEKSYAEMCQALGKDASKKERIQFDITDEEFVNAYFDVLHKPYEQEGVDFWWIDWQQGQQCSIENLDPLWLLNHYHFLDNAVAKEFPLILSRYSGVGSHRYPLGFSGDTFMSWETLQYLPYFTTTASNIGYSWWSHDIGGHQKGIKDDELYIRSLQYGVFSPINRLHCMDAEFVSKEPWFYGNVGYIAEEWLRFRHRLIPYLYSAAYKNHAQGVPLTQPLYYQWKEKQAYDNKNEYLFGESLLVAPITSKTSRTGYAKEKIWLPKGCWTDIFTGDKYDVQAGKEFFAYRSLQGMPVFAKEGAILPLSKDAGNSCKNPINLEVQVFNGKGCYELYEDEAKHSFVTCFETENITENNCSIQSVRITGKGNGECIPKNRKITLTFRNIQDGKIEVLGSGVPVASTLIYGDCIAVAFEYNVEIDYTIKVVYHEQSFMERLKTRALRILTEMEGTFEQKEELYIKLKAIKNIDEYREWGDESACLKEYREVLMEMISY